jgi:hypothetical protein
MANKKINQLVAKTTILSTDLFPLGDGTTGQLFKKTIAELQAAIGGAVISVNGLVGTVVLDTDDIQELATPTNKYFTDARARAAISLTVTGNSGASTYSNSTGVLNVPTYTLAGLGGITATFLSGASGIAYNSSTGVITYTGTVFTDASIRALVSAGAGLSYNSSTGVFSYSGTVYTDASIRALISGTAPIIYNNSTGAISISQATTSTNGFLSSTDWNTFNNKQSTLTIGNLTEATSSVLTITGGTGAVIGSGTSIQVKQASSTVSGFLSSTDWSTFNSKQGTITLTTTGTSGAATFSGGTLNIPQYQAVLTNPVTGTGTTNYHAKWTSSSAIGNSLIYDDGTFIGISTASPTNKVHIVSSSTSVAGLLVTGGSSIQGDATSGQILLGNTTANQGSISYGNLTGYVYFDNTWNNNDGDIRFRTKTSGTAVNALTIKGSGNVGIGTSSPSINTNQISLTINGTNVSRLDMQVSGTRNAGFVVASDAAYLETTASIPLVFYTNSNERMRISSDGNIGMTVTPQSWYTGYVALQLGDTTALYGNKTSADARIAILSNNAYLNTSVNWIYLVNARASRYQQNDGDHVFSYAASGTAGNTISWSNALVIKNSGNTLLGTGTDNGERLYVSGSIRATGSITANSDVRLKKNIERIENALQKVSEISGYTYNTIYDEDRHAGVIAQEIDKVLPEIVNKGNDGLMGVEYGNISALLIEAIKDLKVQNDSLQARLSALEK